MSNPSDRPSLPINRENLDRLTAWAERVPGAAQRAGREAGAVVGSGFELMLRATARARTQVGQFGDALRTADSEAAAHDDAVRRLGL